jgi:hypothetical protein
MEGNQVGGSDARYESPWFEFRRECWENSRHNPDLQNRLAGVFNANTLAYHCTLLENNIGSVISAIHNSPL